MRILIADDDPISARVLSGLVEREGHQPVLARDGEAAWALHQLEPFRVVITDWVMPGIDGLELLRRIRVADGLAYTYVIMLTSRTDRLEVATAMSMGADDHLPKPVQKDDLRARLRVAQRIVTLQEALAAKNNELEGANQRMLRELKAAEKAQRALLPTTLPHLPGVRCAWHLTPCDELAGDTLGVVRLDETHLGIYVVDVSGHGVSSALLAVQVSRFLSPLSGSGSLLKRSMPQPPGYRLTPPDEVARELNSTFANPGTLMYFTMFYAVYDTLSRRLEAVCCGHPPPLVLRAGGGCEMPALEGHPIGIFPPGKAEFGRWGTVLAPGDQVIGYSDGITEAESPDGTFLSGEGLCDIASRRSGLTGDALLQALIADVAAWRGGAKPADDLSLVVLEAC